VIKEPFEESLRLSLAHALAVCSLL
jgi:hypothetical protein